MKVALVFVTDSEPGISRRPLTHGWAYFHPDGSRITDREEIDRLNRIALPPAYRDAWFCPHPNGHLLATGFDARGRKQYRYHPDFRAERDLMKYDTLAEFGRRLPLVRRRVERDIAAGGLTRERAVASVVRLLDSGAIRIGSEVYAKANRSFGASTLRVRHASVKGRALRLRFRAKSGKMRELNLTDRNLIRFVRAVQDLPGQHLFRFLAEDGTASPVGSSDVNDYLRETMGESFTAKHFRTWKATLIAFETLVNGREHVSVREVTTRVSEELGNTPAVARKSYIHPALLDLATDRAGQEALRRTIRLPRRTKTLSRHERGLILFLEQNLHGMGASRGLGQIGPAVRDRRSRRNASELRSASDPRRPSPH